MVKKPKKTTSRDGIIHSYRKAIAAGPSLAITIPAEWCKEHDIHAGDEFTMTANNMISIIKSPPKKTN